MRTLAVLGVFYTFFTHAGPATGGGKALTDFADKLNFIRIETPQGYSCSATRVAPAIILTAAHCVLNDKYQQRYKTGDYINKTDTVAGVKFHPLYIDAKKKTLIYDKALNELIEESKNMTPQEVKKLANSYKFKTFNEKFDRYQKQKIQFDIAFIILKEYQQRHGIPYPSIVSPDTKIKERGKVKFIGYGATKKTWSKKEQDYISNNINPDGAVGENYWACPGIDYTHYKDVDVLKQDIFGVLNFNSIVKHTIKNSTDNQKYEQSTLLGGDSGSGAVEKDINNAQIITAIASVNSDDVEYKNNASLIITLPNGKVVTEVLAEFPDDWGDAQIKDMNFKEIQKSLKDNNLLTKDGKLKPGIQIERQYARVSKTSFADLLHPKNQSFINSIMKEYKE